MEQIEIHYIKLLTFLSSWRGFILLREALTLIPKTNIQKNKYIKKEK